MGWDRYLSLTQYERFVMHDELTERIQASEPESGELSLPSRPKEYRR